MPLFVRDPVDEITDQAQKLWTRKSPLRLKVKFPLEV